MFLPFFTTLVSERSSSISIFFVLTLYAIFLKPLILKEYKKIEFSYFFIGKIRHPWTVHFYFWDIYLNSILLRSKIYKNYYFEGKSWEKIKNIIEIKRLDCTYKILRAKFDDYR